VHKKLSLEIENLIGPSKEKLKDPSLDGQLRVWSGVGAAVVGRDDGI
jgi:hypothetical protein